MQDIKYFDKDIRTSHDGGFLPIDNTFHILRKSK